MSAAYETLIDLHPRHARELYDASGIDPAVVAARGYRSVTAAETARFGFAPVQQRDGLLLPQWTLAGVQVGELLKPDDPRFDEKGKPIKYEAPVGSRPHFDLHPDAIHVLQEAKIPLYFTEGVKKSDAAWSHGIPCVSITSVWMFLNGRMVVPDLDEIALQGRVARVVFDSDVMRKASVAEALLRFCAVLDRRGAKVEVVYLPEGEAGAKVGLDDWFVAGNTAVQLEALARPWDGKGPGVRLRTPGDVDPDEQAQAFSSLVQAVMHPEYTMADLRLMVGVMVEAQRKRSRGEVTPDGRAIVTAAEVSDDWRPVPDKGQPKATVNPNGSKPRLARTNVKPLMQQAVKRGLIAAEPIPTNRRHANGTRYRDVDWSIPATGRLTDMLNSWAMYRPEAPKQRKPRTVTPPCKFCGEVHPLTQTDYCGGCGAELDRRTIEPKTAEDGTRDNLSHLTETPVAAPEDDAGDGDFTPQDFSEEKSASPSRPYLRIVAPLQRGTDHNTLQEPEWLLAAPDPWGGG